MKELNIFNTYASKNFDVFFQKEAALDTEVDIYYLKSGEDAIDAYVNDVIKPELNELVEEERTKVATYHIDLNNNILSLSGTGVQTSSVDLSDLPFADRYLTRDTQQNIDALKTFTQNPIVSKNVAPAINVQNTSVLFGSAPEENQVSAIKFVDSTETLMGAVKSEVLSNGSLKTSLSCSNLEADEHSEIELGYDENGNVYTKAPIPSTTTSAQDDKIATTGWVNSSGNNVVHIADAETITGTKTFSASPILPTPDTSDNSTKGATTAWVKNQGYITSGNNVTTNTVQTITATKTFQNSSSGANLYQTTTDTQEGAYIDFVQQINGTRRGTLRTTYNSDGSYTVTFGNNGPNGDAPQGIAVKRTSTAVTTTAPACDTTDSIVTTKAISKAQNGYCKLGNGLIIQWGYSTASTLTVTLPTPFTSTNYSVSVTCERSSGGTSWYGQVNTLTTTQFTWVKDGSDSPMYWVAIGY